MRRLKRLAVLSPGEALLLPVLALGALACAVGVRMVPLPTLARLIRPLRRVRGLFRSLSQEEIFALTDLAARITHGQNRCLPRSILLLCLIDEGEAPLELRVGVSRTGGALEAHAWIERGGEIVGEPTDRIEGFPVLVRIGATS